ncbi:MAG: hypothetical protein QM702_21000 [Rubrivivax sp.]
MRRRTNVGWPFLLLGLGAAAACSSATSDPAAQTEAPGSTPTFEAGTSAIDASKDDGAVVDAPDGLDAADASSADASSEAAADGATDAPADAGPVLPTCSDGAKNGDETDVDCGGAACAACANGKTCAVAPDCVSGICTAGVCKPPPPVSPCSAPPGPDPGSVAACAGGTNPTPASGISSWSPTTFDASKVTVLRTIVDADCTFTLSHGTFASTMQEGTWIDKTSTVAGSCLEPMGSLLVGMHHFANAKLARHPTQKLLFAIDIATGLSNQSFSAVLQIDWATGEKLNVGTLVVLSPASTAPQVNGIWFGDCDVRVCMTGNTAEVGPPTGHYSVLYGHFLSPDHQSGSPRTLSTY